MIFGICCPLSSKAYSVLAHEAIIDALWEKSIQPLIRLKYPEATGAQLKEAHAYAYGGAIFPDIGYFPFGSILFTNLVHYVRSGDFMIALLNEAHDINEYAFALGAVSHYEADKYGHLLATNRCVPMVYPGIKKKFGDVVTYCQDHISHSRTEFGFDVLQTVKGNYASEAYHDFIGFQVSRPVLERAFLATYGLDINDIFGNLTLAIGSFRWSVKNLFPTIISTAWATKKAEITKLRPGITSREFRYQMRKANYYQEFGKEHKNPGVFAVSLSLIIRILPKIGPLRTLKFKVPGPIPEKLFIQSFDSVLFYYTVSLKEINAGNISFSNIDFDTGKNCLMGEYPLTDKNYGNLLLKLQEKHFLLLTPSLKQNILGFYTGFDSVIDNDRNLRQQNAIRNALAALRIAPAK
jgi:hypothetical protein